MSSLEKGLAILMVIVVITGLLGALWITQRSSGGGASAIAWREKKRHGTIWSESSAIGVSVNDIADHGHELTITNTTARLVSKARLTTDWLRGEDGLDDVPYWIVGVEGSGLLVGEVLGGPAFPLDTPPPASSIYLEDAFGAFHVWEANGGKRVAEGALEDPSAPASWFTFDRLELIASESLTITEATSLPYED